MSPAASGYSDPEHYTAEWDHYNHLTDGQFSLDFSLRRWRTALPPGFLADRLGRSPRCLVCGCASLDNIGALIRFLASQGIDQPAIEVVDLLDLAALGRTDPQARYHVGDVAELGGLFATGSFDLVIQDHLLNCAPLTRYDRVIAELARLLRPGGVALMNYTDNSLLPVARGEALLERFGAAFVAAGYTLSTPDLAALPVEQRLMPCADGFVLATLPLGNLESFMPVAALEERLARVGLRIERRGTVEVTDSAGLRCRRHHCLLGR